MYKVKLFGFAVVCMVGLIGVNTDAVLAAKTSPNSTEQSGEEKNPIRRNPAFEQKMKEAKEKWDSLTDKQKQEVYKLMEDDMQAQAKVMDKLVEFGVFTKEDAQIFNHFLNNKFNKMKKNGEFPFIKQNRK